VDANSVITGDVRAGDDIILDGRTVPNDSGARVTVSGGKRPNGSAKPFPTISPSSASWPDKDVSGTETLAAGVYYFDTLRLRSNATLTTSGPVTIYVRSTIRLEDGSTLGAAPGGNLTIVGKSDGSLTSDSKFFYTGANVKFYGSMYGYNTNVQFGTNAQIFGSIVARTVYAQSSAKFHFDRAMTNTAVCQGGNRFNIVRGTWREVIPAF
jgi:hypothetical protein